MRSEEPLVQDLPSSSVADRHLSGKKVLVTGATGFIGSHLVERLVSLGAQVTAVGPGLGWRPTVRNLVERGSVRFVTLRAFWNPISLARVASEFDGTEYVVHLGYTMPRGESALEKAIDDIRRNVLGTLLLVRRLPASVSRICFASSAMVYGPDPPQPVSEAAPVRPATAYAIGKLAAETHLRLYGLASGVPVLILRYATVYGPMETVPRAIPNFIRNVLAGRPPIIHGSGDAVRDYVHVLDVVTATILALVKETSQVQVFNVGTGKGHTTHEIAERITRLADINLAPVYRPAGHGSNKIVCDISHAHDTLGYAPKITLDEGLIDEIRFFSENPKLWKDGRER